MYWVLCGIRAGSLQLEGNYWCILTGATLQPLFIALSTGTKTLPHKLNALNRECPYPSYDNSSCQVWLWIREQSGESLIKTCLMSAHSADSAMLYIRFSNVKLPESICQVLFWLLSVLKGHLNQFCRVIACVASLTILGGPDFQQSWSGSVCSAFLPVHPL